MEMPGILVGIDGSGHSRVALEWAAREAALRHAPLSVLIVQQPAVGYIGYPVGYPAGDDDLTGELREAARKETSEVLDGLGDGPRPASVTVQAVSGLPAEEILDAAENADLVVVGTRGAGGFKHLLMGSVSSQVTHHAHCPVVVVR
ncbi:MAG: universal stress protein [Nocardiopsaceae bacterium]|nr:universal stress protein [Nocardiopsaceae bacterium]